MIRLIVEQVLEGFGGEPIGSTYRTFDVDFPALETFLRDEPGTRFVAGAEVVTVPPVLRPVA